MTKIINFENAKIGYEGDILSTFAPIPVIMWSDHEGRMINFPTAEHAIRYFEVFYSGLESSRKDYLLHQILNTNNAILTTLTKSYTSETKKFPGELYKLLVSNNQLFTDIIYAVIRSRLSQNPDFYTSTYHLLYGQKHHIAPVGPDSNFIFGALPPIFKDLYTNPLVNYGFLYDAKNKRINIPFKEPIGYSNSTILESQDYKNTQLKYVKNKTDILNSAYFFNRSFSKRENNEYTGLALQKYTYFECNSYDFNNRSTVLYNKSGNHEITNNLLKGLAKIPSLCESKVNTLDGSIFIRLNIPDITFEKVANLAVKNMNLKKKDYSTYLYNSTFGYRWMTTVGLTLLGIAIGKHKHLGKFTVTSLGFVGFAISRFFGGLINAARAKRGMKEFATSFKDIFFMGHSGKKTPELKNLIDKDEMAIFTPVSKTYQDRIKQEHWRVSIQPKRQQSINMGIE